MSVTKENFVSYAFSEKVIVARLEHAGRTLIAMANTGYSTRLSQPRYDVVRKLFHDEAPKFKMTLPAPTQSDVSAMDEAYGWITCFVPPTRLAVRRVLHARSLVHPLSDRHLFSWRRVGIMLGMDYRMVQRLHEAGIKNILQGAVQMDQNTA